MNKLVVVLTLAVVPFGLALGAQERKPVPKDSVRVLVPGCTKGYVFTAAQPNEEHPGSTSIPAGTHLRMNGPKALIKEIKAHEGSMIEITGLIKRGQFDPNGLRVGGVTIRPAEPPTGGGFPSPVANQIVIDVEGWHPVVGSCRSR